MRIAVIGAGGVGGFLGGLLARAGHDVAFLARGPHLLAIRQRGLQVRSPQAGTFTVHPLASDDPGDLGERELALLGVKMYDFAAAAEAARHLLAPNGRAVTIQNGLDAPDELAAAIGPDRVIAGTAAIEATILEPGVIGHLIPVHQLRLAALQGPPTEPLNQLAAVFREAGIAAATAPDGRQALWEKMGILVPFATLTSAGNLTLGDILSVPEAEELFARLTTELLAVASACGHDVAAAVAAYRALVAQNASAMAGFTSSMNRDFCAGKRHTELEWITGKLVRLGVESRVDVTTHQTLYGLLKARTHQRTHQREDA
ncbi:MAG: ketopantoate reductase family protein [Chloroflexota bacterium]